MDVAVLEEVVSADERRLGYSPMEASHPEKNGILRPGKTLALRMKQPLRGRITLREWGSDLATFEVVVRDEEYKFLTSHLPAAETVIDLGANIGLSSLYFAYHWPSCRILAVEPNPETYNILESNLAPLFRSGRCRTLQAAVWNSHVKLSSSQAPGHFSAFSVHEAAESDTANARINGKTMAEIIAHSGFKAIDLLKVDIEGAEVQLFDGSVDWLSRVGSIAIEFHQDTRASSRFDEIVAAYGFRQCGQESCTVLVSKVAR